MTEPKRPGADVALAEFNALRGEILAHLTAIGALLTLALTAIGIVGGFVLDKGGSNRLLLILPFLVCAIGIQCSEHTRRIFLLDAYIRDELWRYLTPPVSERDTELAATGQSEVPAFPNWGETRRKYETRSRGGPAGDYVTYFLLHGLPGGVVFGLGSVVPLAVLPFVKDGLTAWYDWIVWVLGLLLTVLYAWLAYKSERPAPHAARDASRPQ